MLIPLISMTKPADFTGNKMAQLCEKQCSYMAWFVCEQTGALFKLNGWLLRHSCVQVSPL